MNLKKGISKQMDTTEQAQPVEEREKVLIAIIDDAYDDNFEPENHELLPFWTNLIDDRQENYGKLTEEFAQFQSDIGKSIKDPKDIDKAVIEQLWQRRSNYPNLEKAVNRLFDEKLQKLEPLNLIRESIDSFNQTNSQLEFEVLPVKSDFDIKDLAGIDIVFLDYRLGTEGDIAATERAAEVATKIYEKFSGDGKLPLLILMSSDGSVLTAQEHFRKRTKWLKGLFYCLTKNELAEKSNLNLRLLLWKENAKQGLKIHEFIEAVSQSINNNKDKFIEAIKDLSLQDYSYVTNFTLKDEGQPLSEYMLWLFNSYLSDLIFDKDAKLLEEKTKINEIQEFDPLPKIAQLSPSMRLVDMYASTLFNIFPTGANTDFVLKQGLTFVNHDKKKVWLVLNAECDLIRSPIPNITLIEGNLVSLTENVSLEEQDVKLFSLGDDKNFRIKWLWKNTFTVREKNIEKFLRRCKFTPLGVLRTPFFFKLQQYYFNQISRVGLPVSPPIYQGINIELLSRADNQNIRKVENSNIAFLLSRKTKDKHEMECHFTAEFVKFIREEIEQVISKAQEDGAKMFTGKQITRLSGELEKSNEFFIQNSSMKIVNSTIKGCFNNYIGIGLNCDLNKFTDWKDYCLIVNFMSDANSVNNN